MSGKYYWDDVDLASITGASAEDYKKDSDSTVTLFASFPGKKEANLPGYKTYTSNETNEPPFYDDNGLSVFRNIQVASSSSTSSNMSSYVSFTTPNWANACKIYLVSKKGSDGSNASGIAASNVNTRNNDDRNDINNENHNDNAITNRRRNNRNNNRNDNRHHNRNAKWSAQGGFTGGSGGQGRVYSTSKAFILNSNDEVQYKLNSSGSDCRIVNGGTIKGQIILTNGGNGTNATASSTTINRNITAYHDDRRNNAENVDAENVNLGGDANERHNTGTRHFASYFQDNDETVNPNNALNNRWPTIANTNLKGILNANSGKGKLYEGNWTQNELLLVSGSNGSDGGDGAKTTETVLNGYSSSNSETSSTTQKIEVYWFKI